MNLIFRKGVGLPAGSGDPARRTDLLLPRQGAYCLFPLHERDDLIVSGTAVADLLQDQIHNVPHLGKDLHGAKVSARNVLCGTADRIAHGPVNAEVTVVLPGGSVLTSIITEESAKRLILAKGDHVCALVKASSVILGVDA